MHVQWLVWLNTAPADETVIKLIQRSRCYCYVKLCYVKAKWWWADGLDNGSATTFLRRLQIHYMRRWGALLPPWFKTYLSGWTQTFHINGLIRSTTSQLLHSTRLLSQTGWVYCLHGRLVDVSKVFNRHRVQHHLHADDKQAYVDTPVSDNPAARATLQCCILDVGDWCSSRRLQLNETKTKLIWFGSKILGKVPESELNPTVGSNIIQPVKSVCNLGVQLDTEISIKTHVSKVASSCFYQLHHLRQIRRLVSQEVAAKLVSMFILWLDYCTLC